MNIYIGHSSELDFEEQLYEPLKESTLSQQHDFTFPHEYEDLFHSKTFLKEDCDLFVAEVTNASTGLGIELGWADSFGIPVLAVHEKGSDPSTAVTVVADEIVSYTAAGEIPGLIAEFLENR